jgi:hypothetical protein
MEPLLIPSQAGQLIHKTPNALAVDRHRRRGLPYVRIPNVPGGRIYYRRDAIEDFIRKSSFNGDGTPAEPQEKPKRRKRAA